MVIRESVKRPVQPLMQAMNDSADRKKLPFPLVLRGTMGYNVGNPEKEKKKRRKAYEQIL